ncbi:similar to F-box protein 44 (predicted), isoform CRA_d [Rattus norvegicus]|uniref:Similar to F-box protein 44 (Predicted), isoform CRA_d n=2 Tax=Rattus norvegicus TaxID=10116 RepID=A6IU57_RAT|nr:similar to F-box protein 44 (predicted), isoform CRA_d [Rattus norvegicus]
MSSGRDCALGAVLQRGTLQGAGDSRRGAVRAPAARGLGCSRQVCIPGHASSGRTAPRSGRITQRGGSEVTAGGGAPCVGTETRNRLGTDTMAVGNINELPENILLELFTHIPARQLLLRCRPVCSLWRDLIDLVTLWKRKCLQEGFITEDWDQPVADWKIFYFLRSLQRNLLHNPCAEEGFEFWSLDVNGGDEWKVEDLSKDQRKEFPNDQVSHTFSNYPPGVRYIWFQHGGVDTHYWAGWYGPRVTNSSVIIGPPLP